MLASHAGSRGARLDVNDAAAAEALVDAIVKEHGALHVLINNVGHYLHAKPFADLTMDAARAKGYIKGHYKVEEWFGVTKRVTTPTTIYKKQKLEVLLRCH